MFYNYTISLYKKGNTTINKNGVAVTEEDIFISNLKADLQGFSKEQVFKTYGFNIECTNRMFCKYNSEIKIDRIIKYNNTSYKIVKIIEYNNYMDVILNEL